MDWFSDHEYYKDWNIFKEDEENKWVEWQRKLLEALAKEMEQERASKGMVQDIPEEEQRARLRRLANELSERDPEFSPHAHNKVIDEILDDQYRMGPVQELWANPWVSDIQVYVPWDSQYPQIITYVERGERKPYHGRGFRDYDHARDWLNRHLSRIGLRYDPADVQLDGMFPNGERIHVISGPVGYSVFEVRGDEVEYKFVRCMIISIRRFVHAFTLDDLTDQAPVMLTPPPPPPHLSRPIRWERRTVYTRFTGGMLDQATRDFLSLMTKLNKNHIISGGTGVGKTTIANALTSEILKDIVLLILEEAPEMQPQRDSGVIRIYERKGISIEGGKDFTIADGLKGALRMFPDRIFVAELRDSVAFVFLDAIQSGHDGSSSTVHASSCRSAIRRIISMAAQHPSAPDRDSIREILFERVDTIVHGRREGKKRILDEVVQLRPDGTLHTVMEFVQQGIDEQVNPVGYWAFYGPTDEFVEEMIRKGYSIPDSWHWIVQREGEEA
jgi:pilus assembly protein CpaF